MTYDTKGVFRCYEIKVTKTDFHSHCHNSFVGDLNYYVLPADLYEEVKEEIPDFVGAYIERDGIGLGVWDYSNQPGNVLGQICPAFGLLWFFIMPLAIWAEDTTRYLIWAYDCAVYHSQEAPPTIAPYSLKSVYGDFICGR